MNFKNKYYQIIYYIYSYLIFGAGGFVLGTMLGQLNNLPLLDLAFLTPLSFLFFCQLIKLPSGLFINLSYPINMGTLLIFGPLFSFLTYLPGIIYHGIKRKNFFLTMFNLTQVVLSLYLTNFFVVSLFNYQHQIHSGGNLVIMLVALFLMDLINKSIVSLHISLEQNKNFITILCSTLIFDVFKIIPINYPLGIVFALLYQQQGLLGGLLATLPLISVYFILLDQKNLSLIKKQANKDALTSLFNRRYLRQWLSQNFTTFLNDNRELSAIMIDIDNFKSINDKYGHIIGDKTLQELSTLFLEQVNEEGLVIRFGGEEFLILLPDISLARACQIGEKIRQETALQKFTAQSISLTLSLGVSSLQQLKTKVKTPEDLIRNVDKASYQAKFAGKNRLCKI